MVHQLDVRDARSAGVEAALDYACEAYSRFPRHPVILYNLACYQALLGRKNKLAQAFKKQSI